MDRWAADAAAMLALPPTPPAVGWAITMRLGRDHYVRLDANDYSVHPCVIGRKVTITDDLDTVRIHCGTALVGEHRRCWARHQTISDPVHVRAADQLRARRRLATTAPPDETAVAYRDLADYDRILGIDGEVAS